MFDEYDVDDFGPPITEVELDDYERQTGRSLPLSFRRFLIWKNGGTPFRKGWPEGIMTCVRLFWPKTVETSNTETNVDFIWQHNFNASHYNNIYFLLENFEPIPKNITPLGRDSGNSLFFFDTREGPEPKVRYGPYLEPHLAAVVAQDFMGFLSSLKREDEI